MVSAVRMRSSTVMRSMGRISARREADAERLRRAGAAEPGGGSFFPMPLFMRQWSDGQRDSIRGRWPRAIGACDKPTAVTMTPSSPWRVAPQGLILPL